MNSPTASSRASRWTTLLTSPNSFASAAENLSPVRMIRRQTLSPILLMRTGDIVAGAMPSVTSLREKVVSSEATTMSQAATSPNPPPYTPP